MSYFQLDKILKQIRNRLELFRSGAIDGNELVNSIEEILFDGVKAPRIREFNLLREALNQSLDPIVKSKIIDIYHENLDRYSILHRDNPDDETCKFEIEEFKKIQGYIYIVGGDTSIECIDSSDDIYQRTFSSEVFFLDPINLKTTKLSDVKFYVEGCVDQFDERAIVWRGETTLTKEIYPKNKLVDNFLEIIEHHDPTYEFSEKLFPNFDEWCIGMWIHSGVDVSNYEDFIHFYPWDLNDYKKSLDERKF